MVIKVFPCSGHNSGLDNNHILQIFYCMCKLMICLIIINVISIHTGQISCFGLTNRIIFPDFINGLLIQCFQLFIFQFLYEFGRRRKKTYLFVSNFLLPAKDILIGLIFGFRNSSPLCFSDHLLYSRAHLALCPLKMLKQLIAAISMPSLFHEILG